MFNSADHRQLRLIAHGRELPLQVYKTQSGQARRQGLLKTDELPADCALLLPASPVVHMIGMRYPLELIFISRKGRVTKINTADPGLRLHGSWAAWSCLETVPGTAAGLGIRVGDKLEFQELR